MVKIQEPSSSIRETERKESPEWQCTSVPPLEGTREWQNPVTTTFLSQESLQGRCPLSRGALPRPHVLVSQRNARILYASETTRLPTLVSLSAPLIVSRTTLKYQAKIHRPKSSSCGVLRRIPDSRRRALSALVPLSFPLFPTKRFRKVYS